MRSARRSTASSRFFAFCAVAIFIYGFEHWRRRTSVRVMTEEQTRFVSLTRCLLGDDGVSLLARPTLVRSRFRALAMQTALTPQPTWLDRCVPLARALAIHAATLEATHNVASAQLHVSRQARDLALYLHQTGLVWLIRAGDPSTDVDQIAELLVQTGAELSLAGATISAHTQADAGAGWEPAARPPPMPEATRLDTVGLEPLPVGTVDAFLVGTPLPLLSRVRLDGGQARVEIGSNIAARAWQTGPHGLVRILPEDGRPDGLAPMVLETPSGVVGPVRVAAPPARTRVSALRVDALEQRSALWMGQSVLGAAPRLARLPIASREAPSAVSLTAAAPQVEPGDPVADDIALSRDAAAVYALFFTRTGGTAQLHGVRAPDRAGGALGAVDFVESPWVFAEPHPRVTACESGQRRWVIGAGAHQWRVGHLEGARLVTDAAHSPRARERFDSRVIVRCDREGVLVYNALHPRQAGALRCHETLGCTPLPLWEAPHPPSLPTYETPRHEGDPQSHDDWPLHMVALTQGGVLAARASGTIVSVARWSPQDPRWRDEAVIVDAASQEHGRMVRSMGLYSDGARVVLAAGLDEGLAVYQSRDGGRNWGPLAHAMAAR